jgi:cbb3-type cytochrome c oxidase subunit III
MKYAHLVLALLGAGLIAGCANPSRSRDLANPNVPAVVLAQQVCSNCHGIDGTSVSPNFPNLAAQTPAYIVGQLKDFKSHGREDPAGFEYMWGLSRALTDEQINGLAAYFASQTPRHRSAEADAKSSAAGKAIFVSGLPAKNVPACMTCHGESGQGNDAFPRLASQHVDYIVKQLVVFQRTNERPKGAVMKTIVHDLSADDIKNVAAYVQSLGNP